MTKKNFGTIKPWMTKEKLFAGLKNQKEYVETKNVAHGI
jgi:hypothetical protein